MSKEAVALVGAVGVVVLSLYVGAQSSSARPKPVAAQPGAVLAVASADAATASNAPISVAAGGATSFEVVPAASAGCGTSVVGADQLQATLDAAADCTAADGARVASVPATLRRAVDDTRAARATLLLTGDVWASGPPVTVDPARAQDPQAWQDAIKAAQAAGVIPQLGGSAVTVLPGAPVSTVVHEAWAEYLTAAGSGAVTWVAPPA